MSHNILITGGSGYLGGTLLALLSSANLPPYSNLFALVRTPEQAEAVRQYNAQPLTINLSDPADLTSTIVNNKITIIFHLFDAIDVTTTVVSIKALAAVKKETGNEVHFLFTTGAKLFSSHAGAPTDKPLLDTDPELLAIHKLQESKVPFPQMAQGVRANNLVVETAQSLGVRSYIFAPCIVYGTGLGFGNKISIQTVAIVRAAQKLGRVYRVDEGRPTWPVCHVLDNTSLYIEILRGILEGKEIGHGEKGYFLASPGSVAWEDIYEAIGVAMKRRGAVKDEGIKNAGKEVLKKMGEALGCPAEFVPVQVGGLCTFTAEHGKQIGWKPQFAPELILEAADEEVELILKHSK